MPETKFTPGPWRINGDYIEAPVGLCIARIAIIDDSAGTNPGANACVIAKAPELYEDLAYRLSQTRCGCGHPHCNRCEDDKRTESLLAEARGEV
jgi:hypothetical protein